MKISVLFFICSFCLQITFAQTVNIDSLRNLLQKDTAENIQRVKRLNLAAWQLRNTNIQTAQEYAEQAQNIAERLKYKEGIAESSGMLGLLYYREGLHDLAIKHHLLSLELYTDLGNKKYIGYRYNDLANVYVEQKLYAKAVEFYKKSIKEKEQINDIDGIATTLKNIANLHIKQKQYDEALKYVKQALVLADEYPQLNEKTKADLLVFVGEIYLAQDKIVWSFDYFERALAIRKRIKDNFSVSRIMTDIGFAYMKRKNYVKALSYYDSAVNTAIVMKNRVDLQKAYEHIADVYSAKNDYKKAYEYEKKVLLLKDSIYSEGNLERIAVMQTFFDNEKHKTEIDMLNKDRQIQRDQIKQQNLFLYFSVAVLVLLLAIVLLLWRSIHNKKKTAYKLALQNKAIESHRRELEIKNRDVLASIMYAQRIQTAIMPTEEQIQEVLPQSFLFFKPRDIVSGDFYWFAEVKSQQIELRDIHHDVSGDRLTVRFQMDDDTIESRYSAQNDNLIRTAVDPLIASNFYHMTPKSVVAVVDCTGHGVPGAFMSMIGNDLLNEAVKEKNIHSPELILAELHKGIRHVLRQDTTENRDGMDVVICVIDKQHEVLEYAGAMNPLYVVQDYNMRTRSEHWTSITKYILKEQPTISHFDDQLFEIKGDKKPIGGQKEGSERKYTKHTIALAADQQHIPTTFYLCTDGYQDQFGGEKDKKYMAKRLKAFLQEIHHKPLDEQKILLEQNLAAWQGENEQTDDILIFGIRV
jgi:serine phosphatase RsbU (regulator of sigma subunit)